PDLSFTPAVAQLWWRRSSAGIRATQAGTDLAEVSRILGNTLPLDSWVAAVVRSPHRLERRWWSNWLAYRMGTVRPTHHSTVREALVTSIWAGSDSPAVTADILDSVASSLPGFDVGTRTHRPPRLAHLVMWLLVAAVM